MNQFDEGVFVDRQVETFVESFFISKDVLLALGRDFTGERLGHDFAVPHDECVRSNVVDGVGSFRGPENIREFPVDGLLCHAEPGSRFPKLCKYQLEQRPNGIRPLERSVRREQDGIRRIVG